MGHELAVGAVIVVVAAVLGAALTLGALFVAPTLLDGIEAI